MIHDKETHDPSTPLVSLGQGDNRKDVMPDDVRAWSPMDWPVVVVGWLVTAGLIAVLLLAQCARGVR